MYVYTGYMYIDIYLYKYTLYINEVYDKLKEEKHTRLRNGDD